MTQTDIGSGGRLYAVEDEAGNMQPGKTRPRERPVVPPRPSLKPDKAEEKQTAPNWREILSNFGELLGIAAISAGCGWYSPGLGMIAGGVGLTAVGFALSRGSG